MYAPGVAGSDLAREISGFLNHPTTVRAMQFMGAWWSWDELRAAAAEIGRLLTEAGVKHGDGVGLVLRNRPLHAMAILAILAEDNCVATINPFQPPTLLAGDVRRLQLKAIIADAEDWEKPGVAEAAREAGAAAISLSGNEPSGVRISFLSGCEKPGAGPFRAIPAGTAIEMLTSGTTGAAKRIPLKTRLVYKSAVDGRRPTKPGQPQRAPFDMSPAIHHLPLVHASGMFGYLMNVLETRPLILLEKFDVEQWVKAVRENGIKSGNLPPAGVRMILDAKVPKEDLQTLMVVNCGASPLDPETEREFEETYDIPILIQYGATEWIGGLIGWTLPDHREFGVSKRGSIGRPRPDVEVRVVSQETGEELPLGEIGVLEVRTSREGDTGAWTSTSDLAAIDADGFVFIHGRTDDVIMRGGFKINASKVADVLRQHPAIRECVVVGLEDARLGQIPAAAIELKPGTPTVSEAELVSFARERLVPYQVPARFRIVPELPRTVSDKVRRPEVRALFQD